jgi:ferredoxin
MFKRVVRRALGARKGDRKPEAPKATVAPTPTPAPKPSFSPPKVQARPAPSGLSIAERIAAGEAAKFEAKVSATSGATSQIDTGLTTSADGVAIWGSTDNESARARAKGHILVIDQWECISCGTCVENTDAVFVLPDDAKAVVTAQQGDMALIQDAIDACPVTCIHWTATPGEFEQLNNADGHPS